MNLAITFRPTTRTSVFAIITAYATSGELLEQELRPAPGLYVRFMSI